MGCAEEVTQGFRLDSGGADEDPGVIQIMVGDEVCVRIGGDHVVAFVDRHANDEGFAVLMEAGEESATYLEAGRAVGTGFLNVVEGECDLADVSERDWHTYLREFIWQRCR